MRLHTISGENLKTRNEMAKIKVEQLNPDWTRRAWPYLYFQNEKTTNALWIKPLVVSKRVK